MPSLVRCAALAVLIVLSASAWADPIPMGSSEETAPVDDIRFRVYIYRPDCEPKQLLFVFHGLARNANAYRGYAKPLADALCAVVFAPRFAASEFPTLRYQKGGIVDKSGKLLPEPSWGVHYVQGLTSWGEARMGGSLPYAYLGHSGGGQFLSRAAAFEPNGATRIVIANPSSWVWPSLDIAPPYGLGAPVPKSDAMEALRRYLAAPVTVFIGALDTGTKDLDESPEANAQGATRKERGQNAFHSAEAAAKSFNLPFNWRYLEVPGVGHSASKMFASPQALQALQ